MTYEKYGTGLSVAYDADRKQYKTYISCREHKEHGAFNRSKVLPWRDTRAEADADLKAYAEKYGYQPCDMTWEVCFQLKVHEDRESGGYGIAYGQNIDSPWMDGEIIEQLGIFKEIGPGFSGACSREEGPQR